MNPRRRAWLQALSAPALALPNRWVQGKANDSDDVVSPQRALRFPRDHGAHLGAAIEWWYATGWLDRGGGDLLGFQLTFFRSRVDLLGPAPAMAALARDASQSASSNGARIALPNLTLTAPHTAVPDTTLHPPQAGRLVPRQLLFGHAALTELRTGRHRHAQRLTRWSGQASGSGAQAALHDTDLRLGAWRLSRSQPGAASRYLARLAAPEAGFTLDLQLDATQPVLLQGAAGYSRKGPAGATAAAPLPQASHYYTQPQMAVRAQLTLQGRSEALSGRAWLDHEWSDHLLPPQAVGWDWIGINLSDGGALTAFVLRAADGRAVWAGGSHRAGPDAGLGAGAWASAGAGSGAGSSPASGQRRADELAALPAPRNFASHEVAFTPLRTWRSPSSGAHYPVRWRVATPVGTFELEALLDAQELDSRASTGAIYWEGLAELRDGAGRRVGLGYLEMTGRAAPLRLG